MEELQQKITEYHRISYEKLLNGNIIECSDYIEQSLLKIYLIFEKNHQQEYKHVEKKRKISSPFSLTTGNIIDIKNLASKLLFFFETENQHLLLLQYIISILQIHVICKLLDHQNFKELTDFLDFLQDFCKNQEFSNFSCVNFYLLAILNYINNDDSTEYVINFLDKSIEENPKFAPAFFFKGQILEEKQNYEEALKLFSITSSQLEYRKNESLNMEGICHSNIGNTHLSIEKFSNSLNTPLNSYEPIFLLPMFNISFKYRNLKKFEAEIQMLKYLIDALNKQSTVEHSKKEMKEKLKNYQFHFDEKKNNTIISNINTINYFIAESYFKIENFEKAIKIFKKLIENIKINGISNSNKLIDWKSVIQNYLSCLLRIGNVKEADILCDQILEVFPNDITTLFNKSDCLLCLDEPQYAISFLTKAIKILEDEDNDSPNKLQLIQGLNNKGVLLICLKKDTEALKYFNRAYDLDSKFITTIFNICLLEWKSKKENDSAKRWLTFREYPLNEKITYYDDILDSLLADFPNSVPIVSHVADVSDSQLNYMDKLMIAKWKSIQTKRKLAKHG